MLIDDLLDRLRTETPSATRMEMLKYKIALESSRRWTTVRHQTTSRTTKTIRLPNVAAAVQKIGSILDENTGAMKGE